MSDDQPDDTMRGRVDESRLKLRILLSANRWAVAAIPLAGVFVSLIVLGILDPAPLPQSIKNFDPVETLFQAFLTAIITGVTLVVTINQLVLSQELGAVGDQRERMDEALQFRHDAEDVHDAPVSPADPAAFLRALIDASRDRARDLRDSADRVDDDQLRNRITDYAEELTENADAVSDRLENTRFGTFQVVFAALDFNYSWKIYEARRIRTEHDEDLPDPTSEAIDDVIEALRLFGPAREHFKTLYFQWELIDLSRTMLYAAVPALVVAIGGVLFLDNPGSVPGTTAGVPNVLWVVAAATTVALTPFALLLSYILRIATVAKRTLAIGPFVLRDTDRSGQFDDGDRDG